MKRIVGDPITRTRLTPVVATAIAVLVAGSLVLFAALAQSVLPDLGTRERAVQPVTPRGEVEDAISLPATDSGPALGDVFTTAAADTDGDALALGPATSQTQERLAASAPAPPPRREDVEASATFPFEAPARPRFALRLDPAPQLPLATGPVVAVPLPPAFAGDDRAPRLFLLTDDAPRVLVLQGLSGTEGEIDAYCDDVPPGWCIGNKSASGKHAGRGAHAERRPPRGRPEVDEEPRSPAHPGGQRARAAEASSAQESRPTDDDADDDESAAVEADDQHDEDDSSGKPPPPASSNDGDHRGAPGRGKGKAHGRGNGKAHGHGDRRGNGKSH